MKAIVFHAHSAKCECGGVVKMLRDKISLRLLPYQCFCLMCGDQYYVEIDDLDGWEAEQWQQKTADELM